MKVPEACVHVTGPRPGRHRFTEKPFRQSHLPEQSQHVGQWAVRLAGQPHRSRQARFLAGHGTSWTSRSGSRTGTNGHETAQPERPPCLSPCPGDGEDAVAARPCEDLHDQVHVQAPAALLTPAGIGRATTSPCAVNPDRIDEVVTGLAADRPAKPPSTPCPSSRLERDSRTTSRRSANSRPPSPRSPTSSADAIRLPTA